MDIQKTSTRERRRGPDKWISTLVWLGVAGWLLVFAAFLLLGYAKPEVTTFFDRYFQVRVRSHWRMELVRYIFYCMVGGTLLSLTGIVINLKRHRRRTDEFRVSLILVGMISLAGVIFYLIRFG